MFQRFMNHILPGGREAQQQQQQQQQQSREPQSDVNTIMDMGFTEEQARNALIISDNNVSRALDYLLQDRTPTQQTNSAAVSIANDEDEELQRALEESMLVENSSAVNNTNRKNPQTKTWTKTATSIPMTSNRAGQEALKRLEKQQQKTSKPIKKITTSGSSACTTRTTTSSNRGNINNTPTTTTTTTTTTKEINKGPLPLSSKSKEEQIMRSVSRMSPYPRAIDTMLHALRMLQKDSSTNSKFRNIDRSTPGYQQALEHVPGITDLLRALNFELFSDKWILSPHRVIDKALLWMTVASLEQIRDTNTDYHKAKQKMDFIRQVQRILTSSTSSSTDSGEQKQQLGKEEEELRARAVHRNQCPPEPAEGTVQTIIVSIVLATNHIKKKQQEEEYDNTLNNKNNNNNTSNSTAKTILSRRFSSDDTMRDVLHWLGGRASEIPNKLREREWCLRDKNRYPPLPIHCSTEADLNKTLHSVGCWPSGQLELDLSDDDWRQRG